MGRLKYYRNCDVAIAEDTNSTEVVTDHMVHEELKRKNPHNEMIKQENGKRFLTDSEIREVVERFVKDDDIIAQTYDEISKRREDRNFKYSMIKQAVAMVIACKFTDMGIARPSAMKVAFRVVNILYELYMAECQIKQEQKESGEQKKERTICLEQKKEVPEGYKLAQKMVNKIESDNADKKETREVVARPKDITLENATIEAGKIKSLMDMMESYYYDYVSADANVKMESFYCVFDIMKRRFEEFEQGLQHVIYG